MIVGTSYNACISASTNYSDARPIYTHIYIYIYTLCVCACLYVCMCNICMGCVLNHWFACILIHECNIILICIEIIANFTVWFLKSWRFLLYLWNKLCVEYYNYCYYMPFIQILNICVLNIIFYVPSEFFVSPHNLESTLVQWSQSIVETRVKR